MIRMIQCSRMAARNLVLATLGMSMGCVGQVSDAATEEQASVLEHEAQVGVAAMKLLSSQCTRVAHGAGPLGVYDVPSDTNHVQECWLDRGSVGPAVEALQRALVVCWLQNIEVDGDYGPLTQQAVRNVQSSLNIAADGVYGPQTSPPPA